MSTSPEVVIQRQLDAYNAKDLPTVLSCYAEDATQHVLGGELLARGHAEIGARLALRFEEPDLHARLLRREVFGAVVIDHEDITRNLPEGRGRVELLCVYEVEGGLIRRASFRFGPAVPFPVTAATTASV